VTPGPGPLLVYVSNDLMIASPDLTELQNAVTRRKEGNTSAFTGTPFYQQIARSYEQGAEWLFCVDMEQIVAQHVEAGKQLAGGDRRRALPDDGTPGSRRQDRKPCRLDVSLPSGKAWRRGWPRRRRWDRWSSFRRTPAW
jgi:hypothetical protein